MSIYRSPHFNACLILHQTFTQYIYQLPVVIWVFIDQYTWITWVTCNINLIILSVFPYSVGTFENTNTKVNYFSISNTFLYFTFACLAFYECTCYELYTETLSIIHVKYTGFKYKEYWREVLSLLCMNIINTWCCAAREPHYLPLRSLSLVVRLEKGFNEAANTLLRLFYFHKMLSCCKINNL